MNETAKAIRFHKPGAPDVLRVEEVRLPELKGNEVLIRVRAIALSRLDLLWREGAYFEEAEFPAKIGYDAAGVVEAVGPTVKTLKVGDRVSTFPASSLLDYAAHGETIVYPESALLVYPDSLTPVQAAAVNTGLFTAYFAFLETAHVRKHQNVVITAASSSMGIAAIQMTKALRAHSIAVTRSEAKKQDLVEAGADHLIVAGSEDVQEMILDMTEGLGAKVIYDAVAGPGLEELVWATSRSGHVFIYGHLGAMESETSLPLGACFLRAIKVHGGFRIFDFTGHRRLGLPAQTEAVERAKKFICDGLGSKLFTAKIDRVFCGLDEYVAAHRYMETNRQTGKVVIALPG
jgi:NADPH:quinone reductase-like Zn-dependent oxidoreductase